jgi:hypothetical protein
MAALELVAMDMKAQGMYVCRTLSFAGEAVGWVDGRTSAVVDASQSPGRCSCQ